ncbi:MAG: DUF1456 family protein [Gammaproteobacteria bacterium]|nr:DUF1456 family protein [Gammaproteobacteria bacterium]
MNNNDVLRRLRYTFDFDDSKMMALFSLAEAPATRAQISAWLKREDDPAFDSCSDSELASFLNGLIIDRRGKREGPPAVAEKRLTNNDIFRKLKIALDLKSEEILTLLATVDVPLSTHELSAFFRKSGHKHYRECKDQVLRNFIHAIQRKYRPE